MIFGGFPPQKAASDFLSLKNLLSYLGLPINSKKLESPAESITCLGQRSKLGFYVPFNSQGHIGTGPQNCHLWDSNPQR